MKERRDIDEAYATHPIKRYGTSTKANDKQPITGQTSMEWFKVKGSAGYKFNEE